MIEIADIKNRESLEAWLNALPQDTEEERADAVFKASTISFHAALHVLPALWLFLLKEGWGRERKRVLLSGLRNLLVAYVYNGGSTVGVSHKVMEAHEAADASTKLASADESIGAAAYASEALIHAAAFSQVKSFSAVVDAAAFCLEQCFLNNRSLLVPSGASALWNSVRRVAAILESEGEPKKETFFELFFLQEEWIETKGILVAKGLKEEWAFWMQWYNGLLNSTAPAADSPLMIEIAQLPDALWKAEPEQKWQVDGAWEDDKPFEQMSLLGSGEFPINQRINEIWRRHLADQAIAENPIGVRIGYNQSTCKLNSEVIEDRDLEQIVKDVRTALREFKARSKKSTSNLGLAVLSAFQGDIDQLRKDVSKYKSNPRELLRVLEETRHCLARKAEDEGFGRDSNVDRLLGNLHNREDDICAAAPEVLEEVKRRLAVRSQRFSLSQMQSAIRMTAGMASDSEGVLQMALSRALFVVANNACSDQEKTAAWTFILGALPRGAKQLSAIGSEGTDLSKDTSTLDTLVSYADKASKLDKGVDAVQEAVKEGGPWVTETFTQISSGNLWGFGSG